MKPCILIVEDEPDLATMLAERLVAEQYEVEVRQDGTSGLDAALSSGIHLILLDVMLPGALDGFQVCRKLRAAGVRTPVLMLTARGQVADRVAGLRIGADDYLAKPFDPAELLARIEALLRRHPPITAPAAFSGVEVDRLRRTVTRDGHAVELSLKEYELLCYLLDRAGTPVSREELLQKVWRYDFTPNTRTVDVHIAQLRVKLEASPREPRHLATEHGVGYKFVP